MTTYFSVDYDNEALGPFVEEGANLTWTASVGFIVTVIDNGTAGKLKVALISGNIPSDNDVLTQGSVTADADGPGMTMLYPAYFRADLQVPGTGITSWTGPALGTTHSFKFDGQTSDVVASEILTFSGGETCEVITVESDAGASGELSVRFISSVDLSLPVDNDTFTGSLGGNGTVDGVVHDRAYRVLHIHRLLSDLNSNADITGDDDLSRVDSIPSGKDTNNIVNLLSTIVIDDTIAHHMYDGSISQSNGDTLYSGVNLQVTTPNSATQPVLIQNDAIVTDYWANGFMPHSIDGNIRIMIKTRDDGVDIDGKRTRGALLEFGDSYFFGGTTLGVSTTALALFSSSDGNNATAVGTVAGAPYNTIAVTEGFQTIDYNNGNGATEYGLKIDFGSANSLQTYERTKYIQRRGTVETLFGRNAQLFIGINKNFAYDTELANLTEPEVMVWGTEITYSGQGTNFSLGEVITFSGGGKGRLLYDNDAGATGTLIVDLDGAVIPISTETMTGVTSGGDGTVGTVTSNTNAGSALLLALDDDGVAGNMYLQVLTGLDPADNQLLYGETSNSSVAVQGALFDRTINNQFVGVYTGTNYQTNFGIGLDASDGIVGDKFPNLAGAEQEPPNNQSGVVGGLLVNYAVTCYPWDGSTLDVNGNALPTFAEATLAIALTGASTTIDVGTGNIPDNTPAAGFLRVERDSDSNLDLIEYSSHDSDKEYTIVGTAPGAANIGNTVMRAFIDEVVTAGTQLSYTALFGPSDTGVVINAKNGEALNGPIKPAVATAIFGSGGFSVTLSPEDDS